MLPPHHMFNKDSLFFSKFTVLCFVETNLFPFILNRVQIRNANDPPTIIDERSLPAIRSHSSLDSIPSPEKKFIFSHYAKIDQFFVCMQLMQNLLKAFINWSTIIFTVQNSYCTVLSYCIFHHAAQVQKISIKCLIEPKVRFAEFLVLDKR